MPSSSCNSRQRARRGVSEASILPPGNSHLPAWSWSSRRRQMRMRPRRSIKAATTVVTSNSRRRRPTRFAAPCHYRRDIRLGRFGPQQAPARAAGEGHRTPASPEGQTAAVFLRTRVSLAAKSASAAAPRRASTAVSPGYERKSRVPPTFVWAKHQSLAGYPRPSPEPVSVKNRGLYRAPTEQVPCGPPSGPARSGPSPFFHPRSLTSLREPESPL